MLLNCVKWFPMQRRVIGAKNICASILPVSKQNIASINHHHHTDKVSNHKKNGNKLIEHKTEPHMLKTTF